MNNIYKKLSVFLMFLSMVACFMFRLNTVLGTVVSEGTNSSPGGPGGSGCTNNCYNLGTVGMRVSLVNEKGEKISNKAVEYWFYDSKAASWEATSWYSSCNGMSTTSYTTNDSLYLDSNIEVTKTSGCLKQSNFNSITQSLPGILTGMTQYWNSGYVGESQGIHLRKLNSVETIIDRIMANVNGTEYGKFKQKDYGKSRLVYINKILEELGTDYKLKYDSQKDEITSNIRGNYYIQIEPLTQYGNYANGKNYIFYGTVADFYKKNSSITLAYRDGFAKMYTAGISSSKDYPPKKYVASTSPKYDLIGQTNKDGKYYASGVSFISLKEYAQNDCPTQVREAYTTYQKDKNAEKYNLAVSNACDQLGGCNHLKATNYSKYGINPKTITSCAIPTCEDTYSEYIKDKTAIEFINTFLTNNNPPSWNISDSSKDKIKKGTHIWGAQAYTLFDKQKDQKACSIYSCSDLLTIYGTSDTTAQKLDILFNKPDDIKYPLLKKDNYKILQVEPSCDPLPTNCYAKTEGNCSASGALVFSDYDSEKTTSDEHEKCIRKGIAYYDKNQGNLQFSKNERYSTIAGQEIFCSETVTFDLPKESDSILKAGKVFQWGTNIQTETNNGSDSDVKTFGIMTIKQTCYTALESKQKINKGKKFEWDDSKIKTKININYTDPTESYKIESAEYLSPIINTVTYGDNMNSNGELINQSDRFTITAVYNFDYNKNFEWYSDKSDKHKNKDATTKNKDNEKAYVFIGYGLPTSFSTPDGTYDSSLTAIITDIGTNGRFNRFVENILNQSNGFNYSCSFKIHNESFGSECCTKEGEIIPNAPAYCGKCEGDGKPKGLDVVFRPLELMNTNSSEELDKAFPGMSGTGVTDGSRKMGANWAKLTQEEIFDVLDSTVYSNDKPMYEITLNVSTIQKIRQWNKAARQHDIDPYTDMTALTDEQNKDDGNDSYGHTGYVFINHQTDGNVDGVNVMSRFLGQLFRDGNLKSTCLSGSSITNHTYKCQQ